MPLERRADWLVVATRLLLLHSRLLVPASPEAGVEAMDAAAAAGQELRRLDRLGVLRDAAAGLLKVPPRQPIRGRLWLNDGSCVRLRPERLIMSGL